MCLYLRFINDYFYYRLAFCALVHNYYPDLIDFDSLDPKECIKNCDIAFDAAEKAGVPKLLSGDDIGVYPEKRSIQTYVSL